MAAARRSTDLKRLAWGTRVEGRQMFFDACDVRSQQKNAPFFAGLGGFTVAHFANAIVEHSLGLLVKPSQGFGCSLRGSNKA